jgi:hypothetical protein
MIGGGGELKTLRLVAQYGDACNVFGGPEKIHHKFEVLRRHCAALGRPFDEIERSTLQSVNVDPDGAAGAETPAQVTDRFAELGDAGAQHVLFSVRDVWQTDKLELPGGRSGRSPGTWPARHRDRRPRGQPGPGLPPRPDAPDLTIPASRAGTTGQFVGRVRPDQPVPPSQ